MTNNTNIAVTALDNGHLRLLITTAVAEFGASANLNFIDVSNITNFSMVFDNSPFNGDISEWDVSNAINFSGLFRKSHFNGDISKWNVGKLKDAQNMFAHARFNGDISEWNVENLETLYCMFFKSDFQGDISKWNIRKAQSVAHIFNSMKAMPLIHTWELNEIIKNQNINAMWTAEQYKAICEKNVMDKIVCLDKTFKGKECAL